MGDLDPNGYNCRNRLGSMMRKFSWMLLALLVLAGCGEEITQEEEKPKMVEMELPPPSKITWEKDGSQMALVPADSFGMGDSKNEPEDSMKSSRPVHTVELDGFYMDVHEVTVGQFMKLINQTGYRYNIWDNVALYSPGDEYPMSHLSWSDTTAYAKWAGKRLPTEAEWEYAARGGLVGKRYVWGDDFFQARDYANCNGIDGKDKWWKCSPVGSLKPNGYGLYDMAGNVWEWTADWYDERYYRISPSKNPMGSANGKYRVLRGGPWSYLTAALRVAARGYHDPLGSSSGGFRCVADVE